MALRRFPQCRRDVTIGLGKTVMSLAEVQRRMETHDLMKVLVVTTKTAFSVWMDHAALMLPDLPAFALDSKSKSWTPPSSQQYFVVTNWDALRSLDILSIIGWTYVIADEAHYAKNRKAQRTKRLKYLHTVYKRALTGTPIINRPDELWSILNWLYPSHFRSYWKFYNRYVEFERNPYHGYDNIIGPKNVEELRQQIKAFTIRRLKRNVLTELPDKYYETITVELSPQQRRVYEEMRKRSLAWVGENEDQAVPAKLAVSKLIRLRQFCTAYAEISEEDKVILSEPSSKLDAVMDIIEGTDQPVVVFTQFRGVVKLLEARLMAAHISYVVVHGGIKDNDRAAAIATFAESKARVFLCTVQTGGVGITLTASNLAIFVDRSWSPATNLQAEDRLHRFGQRSAVQVVLIQANNTVDQVVEDKLTWKWNMIRKILGG